MVITYKHFTQEHLIEVSDVLKLSAKKADWWQSWIWVFTIKQATFHRINRIVVLLENCDFIKLKYRRKALENIACNVLSWRAFHFINLFCPITDIRFSCFMLFFYAMLLVFASFSIFIYRYQTGKLGILCPVSQTYLMATIHSDHSTRCLLSRFRCRGFRLSTCHPQKSWRYCGAFIMLINWRDHYRTMEIWRENYCS